MKCTTCNKKLTGRQRKYCSIQCKNRSTNKVLQSYKWQKVKGLERKIKLIKFAGGKCQKCGYCQNIAALEFHHVRDKKFTLDARRLANMSWKKIEQEFDKCSLLCSNCHKEEHFPDLSGLL